MDTNSKKRQERNPIERANVFSHLTFFYLLPIFKRGFKNGLTEDDLYLALDEHKSSVLGEKLSTTWNEEHRKHKKWVLHRALCKLFGLNFLLLGFICLINEVVSVVAMPAAIGNLVTYFEKGQTSISESEAYISAAVIVLCRFAGPIVSHGTMMGQAHLSMKMRVACSALIYRKILKVNRTALASTTVGQLVNLLSNDVSKFDQGFLLANFAWVAPIQAVVGTYLLYNEIGVSVFYGMGILLSFIPLQGWFGKKCSSLRMRIAVKTDQRVRLMNEIISGIQVIKMYCWEKPFERLISLVRREEMKAVRCRGYLLGLVYCFEMFITRVSMFVTVLGYVLLGNYISARRMFAVTAIYAILRPVITTIFSLGVNSIAEVYVSVERVQNFLSLEEQDVEDPINLQMNICEKSILEKPKIILKDVSAKWSKDSNESTLKNVNFEITSNQLTAVIGAVGSGKSSLFNVILKELPLESGTVDVTGEVSYSPQEPWLFSGSVRQNILFGDEYDRKRYEEVVKMCALDSDFAQLPYGDKTLVGEKGKALSGGQKARINLARCIYKKADIYLLDDPLSAVDASVGRHLFDKCIKEFLQDRICILITHELQYLTNIDTIVVMENGGIKMKGNYAELQRGGLDFTKYMGDLQTDEDRGEDAQERRMENPNFLEEECPEDAPLLEKERTGGGRVRLSLYLSYFRAGGGICNAVFMLLAFIGAQVVSNSADYFVAYWVNKQEDFKGNLDPNNVTYSNVTFPRDTLLYTYSGIILVAIILGIVHALYFMFFFAVASTNLHNMSFSRMMKASMNFFNHNPSGRILNRFSRDMGSIDEYIPEVMYDVIAVALDLFGAIVLTIIVDIWLCIPSLVLLILFYIFRLFYIETSRSVKRIEGITRSPIYSHMSASMCGLSTIRAFSAQNIVTREFDDYQDKHSSAFFIFLASNRCFGFWVDTTTAVFVAFAILISLHFKQDLHGGDIGLVITQFISLSNGLQWGMRQLSEIENQMISVERLLEYAKVPTDPERISAPAVSKQWPERGQIELRNVSLSYNPSEPPVLKDLTCTVNAREKIGIVGRTGAGKSSLIAALFHLYPIEGKIVIDGVDTTQIPLERVRSGISIIPQEPVLFSETMRKNLDPFDRYDDETLWNALEQVEMKDIVAEMADGLQAYVSEGGSNFSVGQRQLICLARALLRNNKILVMDEATANVDPYTDSLIQNTIREKFVDCTVLTVAHRLHTVTDSDKILLINDGKIEEFDHPYQLLKNDKGMFYNLVHMTGKTAASNLENIARESYMKRSKNSL